MSLPPFPDAEAVLIDLLNGIDGAFACTSPPESPSGLALPLIVVNRIGGGTDDGITDRALCAILVIHSSRRDAWKLSTKVRDTVLSAGATQVNGVLIDTTEEVIGNQEEMDIDPDNRMVDSTFYLSFRRPWE